MWNLFSSNLDVSNAFLNDNKTVEATDRSRFNHKLQVNQQSSPTKVQCNLEARRMMNIDGKILLMVKLCTIFKGTLAYNFIQLLISKLYHHDEYNKLSANNRRITMSVFVEFI